MLRHLFRFLPLAILLFALQAGAADHLPRTWTNSLGIKIEATFVRVEGDQVTLLLDSGQMVTMSVNKFSPADQQYVHDLQAAPVAAPASSGISTTGVSAPATSTATDSQPDAAPSAPVALHKKSILLRPGIIHAADPRVQPKAEIYVTFPELGKARSGEPMGMRIRIPATYSPDHPVPLLVWLSGGDGTSRFNAATDLVNQDDFVLVALTYPAEPVPEPRIAARTGHIDQVWDYEEKMLAKLQEMIPNIDPRLRIAVGFSNGAHIIGGCLAQQVEGIEYFNVYVLIEGGISDKFNYPALPGRYYYVAWGDTKEGRGNDFGQMLAANARKAQMKVEAHPMPGIGHDFPDFEKVKIKEWLQTVVIPGQSSRP